VVADARILRKEARRLLRSVRAGETDALRRARIAPRLAGLDDDDLVFAIRLADAQWAELEAHVEIGEPIEGVVGEFLAAVRRGDGAAARRALRKRPALPRASLHVACALGLAETVEAMLEVEPALAVTPTSPDGWLPLLYVCASPFRGEEAEAGHGLLACAQSLLENGADPNAPSRASGETPLHVIASGRLGAVVAETLLDLGADPNRQRADGKTPYALALRNGRTEVASVLLRRGAEESTASAADRFLGACMTGHRDEARRLLAADPGILDRLTDEERAIPTLAAGEGRSAALRVLADLGFDLSMEGTWAGTPLHNAAWHGQVEAVRTLLDLGVPVDPRDSEFGSSPLGWAAHGSSHCRSADEDYCGVVELLLEAGADRESAVNRRGETPESAASRKVAALLRRKGFGGRRGPV
jgi:ankyrin repeat protein